MSRLWTARPTIGLFAAGLVALSSGACSILFAAEGDQCATDADCQARGAAFDGMRCSPQRACVAATNVSEPDAGLDVDQPPPDRDPFACANLPVPSPDPSRQLDVAIRYTDFSSGTPPKDTLVRLCAAPDGLCNNPRASIVGDGPGDAGPEAGDGWVKVPDDGRVTAKVEFGFEGFFEVKASQYPPTFRATSPPLREKTEFEQLLLRPSEIRFLANIALGKNDAYNDVDYGLVFVFARDCNHEPLAGISFTTSATGPELERFYVINSNPSLEDIVTDTLGRGGFINVPPGIHRFDAWIGNGPDKKKLGTANTLVRAGAATTLSVLPSQ
jgi:hypothetical protein